jgi:hypothetical protein
MVQNSPEEEIIMSVPKTPTFAAAVVLSSTDYVPPAGDTGPKVKINQLRCTTAGLIKVDMPNATGVTIPVTTYDIVDGEFTKIYKTGTDAALWTGCITVFGNLSEL